MVASQASRIGLQSGQKDKIWNKIWERIKDQVLSSNNSDGSIVLVTTYKRLDLIFKEFIRENLIKSNLLQTPQLLSNGA
ncbi:MAG: hypothetical protein AAGE84_07305 [Cyanobacteria bacterium P01_G01_bin.39]